MFSGEPLLNGHPYTLVLSSHLSHPSAWLLNRGSPVCGLNINSLRTKHMLVDQL